MSAHSSVVLAGLCLLPMACASPAPATPTSVPTASSIASDDRPAPAVASASNDAPASAPQPAASSSPAPPAIAPLSLAPPPPPSRATLAGVSISEASIDDIQRAFARGGWKTSIAPGDVSKPVWQVGRYEQLSVRVSLRKPNGKEARAFAIVVTRPAKVAAPVVDPADLTKLEPAKILAEYDAAILDLPYFFDEKAQVLVAGLPIGMPSRDVKARIDATVVKPR